MRYQKTDAAHCARHHAQMDGSLAHGTGSYCSEIHGKNWMDRWFFFANTEEEYGEIGFKNRATRAQGKIKYGGAKCELLRIRCYDDIDLCIHITLRRGMIIVRSGTGNGFVSKVIRCSSKAAHAAEHRTRCKCSVGGVNLVCRHSVLNRGDVP